MIRLSIILPVYNVSTYLEACISTLCCQNIDQSEYEIICVNDGSTDDSYEVLTKIGSKYKNILVINQENMGVSAARNAGLRISQGKYIWFIDPDDYIETMCFGTIIESMDSENADYFLIELQACSEDSVPILSQNTQEMNVSKKKKSLPKASAWQYIVKRDLLVQNNILFHEQLQYGEDYLWALQVWLYGNNVLETQEKIYFYRTRNNSAMSSRTYQKTMRHIYSMMTLAEEYRQLSCKDWPKEKRKEIRRRIPECIQAVLLDMALTNMDVEEEQKIFTILSKKQLYPYKIQWGNLRPADGLTHTALNYISLFFPNKTYYSIVKKCLRFVKGE